MMTQDLTADPFEIYDLLDGTRTPVDLSSMLDGNGNLRLDPDLLLDEDAIEESSVGITGAFDDDIGRSIENPDDAEARLGGADPTRTDLRNACLSIGRAVNFRFKSLRSALSMKPLESVLERRFQAKIEGWDALERIGVVKPILLAEIMELRNLIEHQWADPPDLMQCRRYAEFAFYFLESTQTYLRHSAEINLTYVRVGPPYGLHLTVSPRNDWTAKVPCGDWR
jgi:hypothetical protein